VPEISHAPPAVTESIAAGVSENIRKFFQEPYPGSFEHQDASIRSRSPSQSQHITEGIQTHLPTKRPSGCIPTHRLRRLQHLLMDLIKTLDPDRLAEERIVQVQEQAAQRKRPRLKRVDAAPFCPCSSCSENRPYYLLVLVRNFHQPKYFLSMIRHFQNYFKPVSEPTPRRVCSDKSKSLDNA
jgi:hypothetical protein